MIIVRLKGGIGNQMFQYAFGRKVALLRDTELLLDITAFEDQPRGDTPRTYGLDAFQISAEIATKEAIRRTRGGVLARSWQKVAQKLTRAYHVGWEPTQLVSKKEYFEGYWQSYKYFEDIRTELIQDFQLANPSEAFVTLRQKLIDTPTVGLQVRRGDYVANPKVAKEFGVCSLSYFQNALAEIRQRSGEVLPVIFSDEPEWVKQHLGLMSGAIYVADHALSDAEEIILMSLCTHNIISNSTFGWWGAWLNPNPDKIVVAPAPWFNYNQKDFQFLIPSSWIRLPKN